MHILFLSAWFPYPANNGSKIRIYNLLRGLAQQHEVSLLTFSDPHQESNPEALKQLCREVQILPAREYQPGSMRALLGLFGSKPRVLVDRYQPQMEQAIRRVIQEQGVDLIVASQWYMADYWQAFGDVPAIFEEAEVGVFMDKVREADSKMKRLRHEMTNLKMASYFQRMLGRFDACTVASEQEKHLLEQMAPEYRRFVVIPNTINLQDYRDVREKTDVNSLIFTGSFRYDANYDAMVWFLEKVYPQVMEAIPDVRLTITGDHAGRSLPRTERVVLTGTVKDVYPLIAGATISLAPLQVGGGTRLKILEAMALKTPVVATPKGAEGLDAVDGEHLLIGKDADEFAQAVIRLLKDGGLRKRLVNKALELVQEHYDWSVVLPRYLELVERAGRKAGLSSSEASVKRSVLS